ncbi:hypothetical protein [Savagea faecisuis]|uniref:Uncharacterized protein n=1 Tax=Savagea faecisuis TaxID=1274803 RepID=A0ABW3H0G9_9BACL
MFNYLYNRNVDDKGMHEIHHLNCKHLPDAENQRAIEGYHLDCSDALEQVKKQTNRNNFDGCWHCCPSCHQG